MLRQVVHFHVDCRLTSLGDLHLLLVWVNDDLVVVVRKRFSSLSTAFNYICLDILDQNILLCSLGETVAALHLIFALDLENLEVADIGLFVMG